MDALNQLKVDTKKLLLNERANNLCPTIWIYEFLDNSNDALAKSIEIIVKSNSIIIIDDGIGQSLETHKKGLNTLNIDTDKYQDKKRTGQYQEGSKKARVALSDRIYSISKKDNKVSCFFGNTSEYINNISFLELPKYIQNIFNEKIKESGTMIVLSDLYEDVDKDLLQGKKLEEGISLIYKMFIESGTKFILNEKIIEANKERNKVISKRRIYQEYMNGFICSFFEDSNSPGIYITKNKRLISSDTRRNNLPFKSKIKSNNIRLEVSIEENNLPDFLRNNFTVDPRKTRIDFNKKSKLYEEIKNIILLEIEKIEKKEMSTKIELKDYKIQNNQDKIEELKNILVSSKEKLKKNFKLHNELHPFLKVESVYWESLFYSSVLDNKLLKNIDWTPNSHKQGTDITINTNSNKIDISMKSGIYDEKKETLSLSCFRTSKYNSLEEKVNYVLDLVSEETCVLSLIYLEESKEYKIYSIDSSELIQELQKVNWKTKKNNNGYSDYFGKSKNCEVKFVHSMSGQFWIKLNKDLFKEVLSFKI